ncbi:hypothetical protein Focb16_v006126 [Fusarium oxysporum f. sp. cubense]|uniref:Uncharacterized protein n=1 Tax=Fusarium oxysporum f. sp. cubense TaxID=61366 RepID=A0A559LIR7_FUSOC|nr:hypothetical protein Focb16_v006126 [Fusarium oxysporum f. sp. cubense]
MHFPGIQQDGGVNAYLLAVSTTCRLKGAPFLDSLLPSVRPQTLTSRAPVLGTLIMTIKPIKQFDLNMKNEDAAFLSILCPYLSVWYGIKPIPWARDPAVVFCRTQLEKIGPQNFTADLRDQIFSQMRIATIPWLSSRDGLQGQFDIASKIKTRKGTAFKIFRDFPFHTVAPSKQDILRYITAVGRFSIPLEEINDGNIDVMLVLCIGLLGGERGEAIVIEQAVQIPPVALWFAERHSNNPVFFGPVVSPLPTVHPPQQLLPSPASPPERSVSRGRCLRRSRSRSRSLESSPSTERSCTPSSGSWRHAFHTWIASVNIYKFGGLLFTTGGLFFYMLALFLSSSGIIVLRMEM